MDILGYLVIIPAQIKARMQSGSSQYGALPAVSEQVVPTIKESFDFCECLARSHYENFPVGSLLIPRAKRPYIWSIYAFARIADDIADEGTLPPEARLQELDKWKQHLNACYSGNPRHPVFVALAETARVCAIPHQLFADLLTAFRMDVLQTRYATFDDLLFYCRHSANPVGRLVLQVFGAATERAVLLSDLICTALQLTNFWQDLAVDWKKGRLYLPLEDIHRFGYTEEDLQASIIDDRFRGLMAFEVDRTRRMFHDGRPLLEEVGGRLGFELHLTWHGGMKILEKIEQREYDVLHGRPAISTRDKISILGASLVRSR